MFKNVYHSINDILLILPHGSRIAYCVFIQKITFWSIIKVFQKLYAASFKIDDFETSKYFIFDL